MLMQKQMSVGGQSEDGQAAGNNGAALLTSQPGWFELLIIGNSSCCICIVQADFSSDLRGVALTDLCVVVMLRSS